VLSTATTNLVPVPAQSLINRTDNVHTVFDTPTKATAANAAKPNPTTTFDALSSLSLTNGTAFHHTTIHRVRTSLVLGLLTQHIDVANATRDAIASEVPTTHSSGTPTPISATVPTSPPVYDVAHSTPDRTDPAATLPMPTDYIRTQVPSNECSQYPTISNQCQPLHDVTQYPPLQVPISGLVCDQSQYPPAPDIDVASLWYGESQTSDDHALVHTDDGIMIDYPLPTSVTTLLVRP
jgi:hypothetical protein